MKRNIPRVHGRAAARLYCLLLTLTCAPSGRWKSPSVPGHLNKPDRSSRSVRYTGSDIVCARSRIANADSSSSSESVNHVRYSDPSDICHGEFHFDAHPATWRRVSSSLIKYPNEPSIFFLSVFFFFLFRSIRPDNGRTSGQFVSRYIPNTISFHLPSRPRVPLADKLLRE